MEDFNPTMVNTYSVEELVTFIWNKKVTFSDYQNMGLRYDKQTEVKKRIEEEKMNWEGAKSKDLHGVGFTKIKDAIDAYQLYLDTYPNAAPHSFDAKLRIKQLKESVQILYEDLFADMHDNPMTYKFDVMNFLFGKLTPSEANLQEDSPISRFLKEELRFKFEDLYRSGILPKDQRALEQAIFKPDFDVVQPKIEDLGEVPINRNDVYFLGCPQSGKSCVLAGFLYYLRKKGLMDYQLSENNEGKDECLKYKDQLIKGIGVNKAPKSTGKDTVSFMSLDIGNSYDRKITVWELGGEAFKEMAKVGKEGAKAWEGLGIARCLKNNNSKILFFLLDYSSIIGKNPDYTALDQEQILENALLVLNNDGPEKEDRKKNCTMSKVKTVAVVITKSDLMDVEMKRTLTRKERADIAMKYLCDRFQGFMDNLSATCKIYNINSNNKGNEYMPYVLTFSLGQFFLGNSLIYDETDPEEITKFIIKSTPKKSKGLFV